MCPNTPFFTDLHPLGDTVTVQKLQEPLQFKVIMHNDDYTTMEFVVHILMQVFAKKPAQAHAIMLHIHSNGLAECGVFAAEIAETKIAVVHMQAREAGFPLRCTMEPL